jgi:hypothetical protein
MDGDAYPRDADRSQVPKKPESHKARATQQCGDQAIAAGVR